MFVIPGHESVQMQTNENYPGSILISNATNELSGIFTCQPTVRITREKYSNSTQINFIVDTDVNQLSIPEKIKSADEFWLNCTYSLSHWEKLVSVSLHKDDNEFYRCEDKCEYYY